MINAVIYARYSSDNQREESIDGQIRECMAFAEKSGMTVLRTYIDRALSAKTDNRPEFQNMIKDSSKHLFDVVIVWKLDRFARNRYDSARYKAALKKNGVKVISATELISEGSEGIILESVLEGYAEYYSAELSEKVIRGMTDNALKCKFNGGSLPIGYIVNHEQLLEVDPLTAPVVLDVFNAYSEGKGMKQIADMLNERGIKTRRNTEIDVNIVHAMLKNRRYIGEYKYRDTVIPNGIPAIVSQDLFDRVGEKMAKNRKAPARHKAEDDYILTTKLFCGKCGGLMVGESGTGRKSIVHHYYKCVNVKNHKGCDKKTVKKDWIENLIVEYVMKAVMDDSIIEAVVDGVLRLQKQENRNLPVFEQQLAETKRAIENMLDAIQKGLLTSSTKNRLDQLEATKEDLEVKISLEKLQKPVLTKEYLTFWMHQFRKFDVTKLDQRKRLVDTFVNAIYLFDDKILFTLNYKDGSKTVSLADIGGSDLETSGAPERYSEELYYPPSTL